LTFGDFEDASNLNVAPNVAEVHDDDGPLLQTNHQDLMGNTKPTADANVNNTK
jgi:hypothetical protein